VIGCFIIEDISNHCMNYFLHNCGFLFYHSMIDHCLCFVSNIHTGVFYFGSEKKIRYYRKHGKTKFM
jgi:hypothetical protein